MSQEDPSLTHHENNDSSHQADKVCSDAAAAGGRDGQLVTETSNDLNGTTGASTEAELVTETDGLADLHITGDDVGCAEERGSQDVEEVDSNEEECDDEMPAAGWCSILSLSNSVQ